MFAVHPANIVFPASLIGPQQGSQPFGVSLSGPPMFGNAVVVDCTSGTPAIAVFDGAGAATATATFGYRDYSSAQALTVHHRAVGTSSIVCAV